MTHKNRLGLLCYILVTWEMVKCWFPCPLAQAETAILVFSNNYWNILVAQWPGIFRYNQILSVWDTRICIISNPSSKYLADGPETPMAFSFVDLSLFLGPLWQAISLCSEHLPVATHAGPDFPPPALWIMAHSHALNTLSGVILSSMRKFTKLEWNGKSAKIPK